MCVRAPRCQELLSTPPLCRGCGRQNGKTRQRDVSAPRKMPRARGKRAGGPRKPFQGHALLVLLLLQGPSSGHAASARPQCCAQQRARGARLLLLAVAFAVLIRVLAVLLLLVLLLLAHLAFCLTAAATATGGGANVRRRVLAVLRGRVSSGAPRPLRRPHTFGFTGSCCHCAASARKRSFCGISGCCARHRCVSARRNAGPAAGARALGATQRAASPARGAGATARREEARRAGDNVYELKPRVANPGAMPPPRRRAATAGRGDARCGVARAAARARRTRALGPRGARPRAQRA